MFYNSVQLPCTRATEFSRCTSTSFVATSESHSLLHTIEDALITLAYVIMHIFQRIVSSKYALVNVFPLTCREIGDPNDKFVTTIENGILPGMSIRLPLDISKMDEKIIFQKKMRKNTTFTLSAKKLSLDTVEITKKICKTTNRATYEILQKYQATLFSHDPSRSDDDIEKNDLLFKSCRLPEIGFEKDHKDWTEYIEKNVKKNQKTVLVQNQEYTITGEDIGGFIELQKVYTSGKKTELFNLTIFSHHLDEPCQRFYETDECPTQHYLLTARDSYIYPHREEIEEDFSDTKF